MDRDEVRRLEDLEPRPAPAARPVEQMIAATNGNPQPAEVGTNG
jgi:hypothetical protein